MDRALVLAAIVEDARAPLRVKAPWRRDREGAVPFGETSEQAKGIESIRPARNVMGPPMGAPHAAVFGELFSVELRMSLAWLDGSRRGAEICEIDRSTNRSSVQSSTTRTLFPKPTSFAR